MNYQSLRQHCETVIKQLNDYEENSFIINVLLIIDKSVRIYVF